MVVVAPGSLHAPPFSGSLPPSSRAAMEAALETLRTRRAQWAATGALDRIRLLRELRSTFFEVSEEWVLACMEAEGLASDDPRTGEEWIAGPYFVLRNLRLLEASLRSISVAGHPRVPGPVRRLPNGQVAAQVIPFDRWDRLLYRGIKAEVWMEPGVTLEGLGATQALAYRQEPPQSRVALVLGAGNVSSIGPMDSLYKLFVEGSVVLYKTNPVNDYLGPLLERGFRPLVESGFLRIVYGGAEEGAFLCEHPAIEEIHVTGSDKTYEAIVFGSGEEGARRKAAGTPRLDKPVTAELGNVSPVVVVPGHWSVAEVAFHAENIATMLANNAGFNCNAVRVLVTHAGWPQREELIEAIRGVLLRTPTRRAFYPGAVERFESFVAAHPEAERIGDPAHGELPWGLIPGHSPERRGSLCFTTESFASLFCETPIEAADPADFLDRAVELCNEELWGSLNATLIVHPRSRRDGRVAAALERAIERLRYGTVAVNVWAAAGFGLCTPTWGAFPGHTPADIQSGIGVVHNTLMFSRAQKSVIVAPFHPWPKPPWFVSHSTAFELGRKLTGLEAAPAAWKLPSIFRLGVQGA